MINIVKDSKQLGIIDGKFTPCPNTPNCVSTQSINEKHKIVPIRYDLSKDDAKNKIIRIIKSLKRTKIITQKGDYIHVEFKTRFLKFVDDVEFYFNHNEKIIHFKSASRVGSNDWGLNRKRMETIRKKFFN